MKKIFAFLAIAFSFLAITFSVSAQCGGQYESPCQSYSIIVDKMVQKPGTADYVDNLSVSDPRYNPGNYVMFSVKAKNTSTTTLGGMTVKDFVPSYLNPVESPGTFDASTRTISWDAGFFNVNEEKTFYLKMQVNSQAYLPANQGLFCLTNRVEASSNTTVDDDSSQLCIEKQVSAGVTKVPPTGPELGLLLLAGNILGVGIGLKLKKTS